MKTKIKALGRKIVQNEKLHGRVILGVTLLALIAVLIPLFQIARYNFMSVDDYSYAMHSGQIYKETHSVWKVFAGQIAYVADYYKTWQGTYFSEWLTTSLMGHFLRKCLLCRDFSVSWYFCDFPGPFFPGSFSENI